MPVPATTVRPRRSLSSRGRLLAQGLVLTLVVLGTSAFAFLHKTVTIDVDGSSSTVSAFARTVGGVLAAEGIDVGPHDRVAPDIDAVVVDDGEIVVRHAREVVVEVDGQERTIRTTAQTVGDVVAELGLREGARASASRSASVGRDTLRLSTPKTVHLAVDGRTLELATTASTVREVLLEADVVLGAHDRVSVGLETAVVDGLVVMVTRVDDVTRTETTTQPFDVVQEEDPSLPKGETVVAVEGREGTRVVTYTAYEVDGAEIARTIEAEAQVAAPRDEVVRVGTYEPPPTPAPAPVAPRAAAVEPGTARAMGRDMVLARGWSESEYACLDSLWTKESNWRVTAENPSSGAYGIPQSLPGTKMASVADDWRTNPATQITWGLNYIENRYSTPCGAWAASQAKGWY